MRSPSIGISGGPLGTGVFPSATDIGAVGAMATVAVKLSTTGTDPVPWLKPASYDRDGLAP